MEIFLTLAFFAIYLFVGFSLGQIYNLRKQTKALKLMGDKLRSEGIKDDESAGFFRGALWVFDNLK